MNSFQTDLTKFIGDDFGKSEVLSIRIFNWYKASSTFRHFDFIRAIRIIARNVHNCVFLKAAMSSQILEILSSMFHYRLDTRNED